MCSTYNAINPDDLFDSIVEIDENPNNPAVESVSDGTLDVEMYSDNSFEYVDYGDQESYSINNEDFTCIKSPGQARATVKVEAMYSKQNRDKNERPCCSSLTKNNKDLSLVNKQYPIKSMCNSKNLYEIPKCQRRNLLKSLKFNNISPNEWFIKAKNMYALVYERILNSKAKQLDVMKKFKVVHCLSNEIKAEIVVTQLKKKSKEKTYVYYMLGLNNKLKGNYLKRAKFKTIPNFSSKILKSSKLKNGLFELIGVSEKIKSFKELYSTSLHFLTRKGFRKIAFPHFNAKSSYKKATCDAIEVISKFIEKNPDSLDEVLLYSQKRHIYSSFVEAYCKNYDTCRARIF